MQTLYQYRAYRANSCRGCGSILDCGHRDLCGRCSQYAIVARIIAEAYADNARAVRRS